MYGLEMSRVTTTVQATYERCTSHIRVRCHNSFPPKGRVETRGGEDGRVLPIKDGESSGAANKAASRLLLVCFDNDSQYKYKDNAECATIRVREAE